MPEAIDETVEQQEQEAAVEQEETQSGNATDAPQEGTQDDSKDDAEQDTQDESSLPEWARERLTKANREAASYRTQLREAQEALSKAKTPEEFEAATAGLSATVLKYEVAAEVNLPLDLAKRLSGSTKEELEADAKSLLAFVAPPKATRTPGKPSGGLDPTDETESFDPDAYALSIRNAGF